MSFGVQMHASLQNFSPGWRVLDARSQKAVARLVRRTRAEFMR
jgi:hypothetical protein